MPGYTTANAHLSAFREAVIMGSSPKGAPVQKNLFTKFPTKWDIDRVVLHARTPYSRSINVGSPRLAISMEDTLSFLESYRPPSNTLSADIPITGALTTDAIQKLTALPYEVSATIEGARLFLTTGDHTANWTNLTRPARIEKSPVFLHTHPAGPIHHTPSLEDAYAVTLPPFSRSTLQFIATSLGIIHFTPPRWHPITKEPIKETTDRYEINFLISKYIFEYCEALGIGYEYATRWFDPNKNLRSFNSLNKVEEAVIARGFAEASGMIRQDVPWNEHQAMDRIIRRLNPKAAHENPLDWESAPQSASPEEIWDQIK